MVEFVDGTVLAQLGVTDMRLPIQYALSYPERWASAVPRMDFTRATTLDFEAPDRQRFPCLDLAYGRFEPGARCPRCSTRRTKRRWPPFSTDVSRSGDPRHRRGGDGRTHSAPSPYRLERFSPPTPGPAEHSAASMAAAHRSTYPRTGAQLKVP